MTLNPKIEPVRLVSSLRALVAAVLAILAAFDVWRPDGEQIGAIAAVWVPLELVLGEVLRSKVSVATEPGAARAPPATT